MSSPWPLPVPHEDRTDPLDFLPAFDAFDKFDLDRAEAAWDVFARFPLTEGLHAGKRLGDHYAEWQPHLVKLVYGARDAAGERLFREIFLLIARKGGKTYFSSVWQLAHCMLEPEDRGQVVLLADVQKQAQIQFRNLAAIIRADGYLKRRFKIRDGQYDVTDAETGTRLFAVSSEKSNLIGLGPHAFTVDEVHLIGARPRGEELIHALTTGTVGRACPLGLYTTTQSMGTPAGIFSSMLNRGRRVQRGEAPEDFRFLPVLFEPPQDADHHDRKYWPMANPSINTTITLERLEQDYNVALADPDPSRLSAWCSQHLNLANAKGTAQGTDRWIPGHVITSMADPKLTLDQMLQELDYFWIAIDRGGAEDAAAIVVVGSNQPNEDPDRRLCLWAHQFLTETGEERNARTMPINEFKSAGELSVMPNAHADVAAFADIIGRTQRAGELCRVGFDMHEAAQLEKVCTELDAPHMQVPQGWKLGGAMNWIERSMLDGRWTFASSRMLAWNCDGVMIKWIGSNRVASKQNAKHRIDGVAAWLMAGYLILEDFNREAWDVGTFIV